VRISTASSPTLTVRRYFAPHSRCAGSACARLHCFLATASDSDGAQLHCALADTDVAPLLRAAKLPPHRRCFVPHMVPTELSHAACARRRWRQARSAALRRGCGCAERIKMCKMLLKMLQVHIPPIAHALMFAVDALAMREPPADAPVATARDTGVTLSLTGAITSMVNQAIPRCATFAKPGCSTCCSCRAFVMGSRAERLPHATRSSHATGSAVVSCATGTGAPLAVRWSAA
jgi:hypothetical protein